MIVKRSGGGHRLSPTRSKTSHQSQAHNWVTHDLQLKPAQIKRQYRHRQQTEETFRLLKQEFGWGGSSVRKTKAQMAHLHLGLMALCLTQHAALIQGQTVYAFKRLLSHQPIPNQLPLLEHFLVAA